MMHHEYIKLQGDHTICVAGAEDGREQAMSLKIFLFSAAAWDSQNSLENFHLLTTIV